MRGPDDEMEEGAYAPTDSAQRSEWASEGASASRRSDAPAVAAALELRDKLLRKQRWLTSEGLARRAGVDTDPEAYVQSRRGQHTLLSVRYDGGYLHPACQFQGDSAEPLLRLEDLLSILPQTEANWTIVFWFFQATGRLEGRSPAEVFPVDPDKVIEAARGDFFGDSGLW